MAKKLPSDLIAQIEEQIEKESIPYDYDTKEYPVEVLVAKYNNKDIIVPDYQRQEVWDIKQRSRFIESVFLGVPIMPFLVSFTKTGVLEIIDGSQRIRTLVRYVNDEIKLQGLKKLTFLNGTKFSQMSDFWQKKFKYRDFRIHVITDKAEEFIRADIFDRVNTSSKKLTDSEIRKGSFKGEFYDFVLSCAKDPQFIKLCPISKSNATRQEHDELILRFFTYSEKYLLFKHAVGAFLNEFVQEKNKEGFNPEEKKNELRSVLNFVEKYFEPPYFARKGRDKATPRVRFEAISVGVYLALKEEPNLQPVYLDWLYSKEFKDKTTTDASNNQGKLKERIEFVRDCLLNKIKKDTLKYE
jgi:hypothetical protein